MFGISVKKKEVQDIIKEADRVINAEIIHVNELESSLLKEIRELQHMKSNLSFLKSSIISIRRLSELRENAIHSLTRMAVDSAASVDIEKYERLRNTIYDIDREFYPLINITMRECTRLRVDESHLIYAQESNRKPMHDIDKDTKDIIAEIHIIETKHQGLSNHMGNVEKEIQRLIHERKLSAD